MEALKKKIGIMGGTFNPIHNGHLLLAEHARQELLLDEIWFLPSGTSYMKPQDAILSADKRLFMVQMAVADNPFFKVCDIETKKDGNTYTWETMETLRREYTSCEFTFLMGADSLFQIEKWKKPESIFASCRVGAAVRDGMDSNACKKQSKRLKEMFGADIRVLHAPRVDISSTDIRRRCMDGKSIRYLVPETLRAWMEREKVYTVQEPGNAILQ